MKKAKIMLMAIAVLAVVGGTLAFKAHTFTGKSVYGCTSIGIVNAKTYYGCTLFQLSAFTTTLPNTFVNFSTAKLATSTTVPCTATATIGLAVPPCLQHVQTGVDN